LGHAADPETKDLSDFFKGECGDSNRDDKSCGD